MDKLGEGQEVVAADLGNNRELSLIGFTPQMILEVVYWFLPHQTIRQGPGTIVVLLHLDQGSY